MRVDIDVPANVPTQGNRFTRGLGRTLMRMLGWKLGGELPNVKKCVFIGAPHTSNWDFIVSMISILALGLRASYLMKKEAFFWPLAGFFKALGGVPTDRKAAGGVVANIAEQYRTHDKMWVVLTPEGTRSKVDKWKSGFIQIANQAKVPVVCVAFDYPSKTVHIGKMFHPSGDDEKDMQDIRAYYENSFTGRHPHRQ